MAISTLCRIRKSYSMKAACKQTKLFRNLCKSSLEEWFWPAKTQTKTFETSLMRAPDCSF